ncbi:MAG: DUF1501 domain-containing protein [Pseudomonadota bacterium]
MTLNRRSFLKRAGAAGLYPALAPVAGFSQHATMGTTDYRALVCVFLFGGLDNHDLILPSDSAGYDQLVSARRSLLQLYGDRRARSALLELSPENGADFAARRFALPPEMPSVQALFNGGRLAVLGNVGPLIEVVDRRAFLSDAARLPPKLFSHNDQQSIWQSNSPEGATLGWGGLFTDLAAAGVASASRPFTAMTTAGNTTFLTGVATTPFAVGAGGASTIDYLDGLDMTDPLAPILRAHFRQSFGARPDLLERDVAGLMGRAFDANARYNGIYAQAPMLSTEFPLTGLGSQLRTVAEAIGLRDALGTARQVFFVGMSGFDTHSNQADALPALLAEIDDGLAAFSAAMQELGTDRQVTLFTASDFGRGLAANGDGTDHGWGGHQLVLGGDVLGGRLYGQFPETRFGHDHDAGQGRLIPAVSVDQYAEVLGRWFGLRRSELETVFPNLAGFPSDASLQFLSSSTSGSQARA